MTPVVAAPRGRWGHAPDHARTPAPRGRKRRSARRRSRIRSPLSRARKQAVRNAPNPPTPMPSLHRLRSRSLPRPFGPCPDHAHRRLPTVSSLSPTVTLTRRPMRTILPRKVQQDDHGHLPLGRRCSLDLYLRRRRPPHRHRPRPGRDHDPGLTPSMPSATAILPLGRTVTKAPTPTTTTTSTG